MGIKLCSLVNLDIDAVIKLNPFQQGKKLKKDHLLFIIHCLIQQKGSRDVDQLEKLGKKGGFIPLHSKVLESKIPNYHDCIVYLRDADVIDCDGNYSRGKFSKGYRFTKKYSSTSFKKVEITDFILCQKIRKDNPFLKKQVNVKEFPYLAKWFSDKKLLIDQTLADQWVNDFETAELSKIHSANLTQTVANARILNLAEKCFSYRISIDRFAGRDFFFSIDEKGRRLHTNLTNLSKNLRQFTSYDGKPLVSVDIKNSQPYMSLPLLEKEFWQSYYQEGKPTLKKVKEEMYKKMKENKGIINTIIKFLDSSEMQAGIDFSRERFFKSVVTGSLYEYLIPPIERETGKSLGRTAKEKRNKVKKVVLTVFFDNHKRSYNQLQDSPYQVFKSLFATVVNVFELIKTWDYRDLAILLQRIESNLILEIICKRIAIERPDLPIFTVHDSIVTTEGNEGFVESKMKSILTEIVGFPPQLAIEYWKAKPIQKVSNAA